MRSSYFAIALTSLAIACVSGTVRVHEICTEKAFGTIPAGLPTAVVEKTFETQADFSEVLSKVDDYGDLEVRLDRIELGSRESTDLSFVRRVRIEFIGDNGSSDVLGERNVQGPLQTIVVKVDKTSPETQKALATGPFKLRISGEVVSPASNVTPVVRICASATGEVSYSVTEIGK